MGRGGGARTVDGEEGKRAFGLNLNGSEGGAAGTIEETVNEAATVRDDGIGDDFAVDVGAEKDVANVGVATLEGGIAIETGDEKCGAGGIGGDEVFVGKGDGIALVIGDDADGVCEVVSENGVTGEGGDRRVDDLVGEDPPGGGGGAGTSFSDGQEGKASAGSGDGAARVVKGTRSESSCGRIEIREVDFNVENEAEHAPAVGEVESERFKVPPLMKPSVPAKNKGSDGGASGIAGHGGNGARADVGGEGAGGTVDRNGKGAVGAGEGESVFVGGIIDAGGVVGEGGVAVFAIESGGGICQLHELGDTTGSIGRIEVDHEARIVIGGVGDPHGDDGHHVLRGELDRGERKGKEKNNALHEKRENGETFHGVVKV